MYLTIRIRIRIRSYAVKRSHLTPAARNDRRESRSIESDRFVMAHGMHLDHKTP